MGDQVCTPTVTTRALEFSRRMSRRLLGFTSGSANLENSREIAPNSVRRVATPLQSPTGLLSTRTSSRSLLMTPRSHWKMPGFGSRLSIQETPTEDEIVEEPALVEKLQAEIKALQAKLEAAKKQEENRQKERTRESPEAATCSSPRSR